MNVSILSPKERGDVQISKHSQSRAERRHTFTSGNQLRLVQFHQVKGLPILTVTRENRLFLNAPF